VTSVSKISVPAPSAAKPRMVAIYPQPWRPDLGEQFSASLPSAAGRRLIVPFACINPSDHQDSDRVEDELVEPEDSLGIGCSLDYGPHLSWEESSDRDCLVGQINRFMGNRYRAGGDGLGQPGF